MLDREDQITLFGDTQSLRGRSGVLIISWIIEYLARSVAGRLIHRRNISEEQDHGRFARPDDKNDLPQSWRMVLAPKVWDQGFGVKSMSEGRRQKY